MSEFGKAAEDCLVNRPTPPTSLAGLQSITRDNEKGV